MNKLTDKEIEEFCDKNIRNVGCPFCRSNRFNLGDSTIKNIIKVFKEIMKQLKKLEK